MVSFGLVGPGAFGRFVLSAVAPIPDLRLRWVKSRGGDSAEQGAAQWREARREQGLSQDPVQKITGEGAGWPEEPVDVVVVATPPDLQPVYAEKALRQGAAVFLEKPGALDPKRLKEVALVARMRKLPAVMDFVMRYNPLVELLRRIVETGKVGLPERVQMENWAGGGMPEDHWFWDPRRSGGILVEHGVHFFDMVRYILGGEVVPIHGAAWETVRPEGWRAEDRVLAVVEHHGVDPRSGRAWRAPGSYYHGFTRPGNGERTQTGLVFTEGYALFHGWIPEKLELWTDRDDPGLESVIAPWAASNGAKAEVVRQGRVWQVSFPDRQVLYQQAIRSCMEDLLASLRSPGRPVRAPLEEAAQALELAVSLTRLADTRHTVA
ncbi:Gfo/Idh/MocA family protein [Kyrpidia tusciae]|uniref:Oxidoreductase domain protein n=1 Tax=Kyrpidia tusciae (strain DSM 2912 / NBRC 15312 / T2) TaxID=562970 RepID=D5WUQ9_KYRT2|nr:Gfo/Idh/MocA family oxidoreductase [Kyrpidia tusciae]ADG05449.1 oxidoreductase domain protein [Kyrpidia tusciae DSM 2912]